MRTLVSQFLADSLRLSGESYQSCECVPVPRMRAVALANLARIPLRHTECGSNGGHRNGGKQGLDFLREQFGCCSRFLICSSATHVSEPYLTSDGHEGADVVALLLTGSTKLAPLLATKRGSQPPRQRGGPQSNFVATTLSYRQAGWPSLTGWDPRD
jgi:hypothetical protein